MLEIKQGKSKEVTRPEVLDDLISDFLCWCEENYQYEEIVSVRNFIEDMAMWYELRVPSEEILFKIGRSLCEIDSQGSRLRSKLEETIIKNTDKLYYDLKLFNNSDLFSVKRFIEGNNAKYLDKPRFDKSDYKLFINNYAYTFSLTSKGRVRNFGNSKFYVYDKENRKYLMDDITLDELISFLNTNDFEIQQDGTLERLKEKLNEYNIDYEFKEKLLDSVMYRIIDKGGAYYGATRGYLFAKEFKRNVSIPLKYGLYYLDETVQKSLLNDYINNDGDINIECYSEYFDRIYKYEGLCTSKISEYMSDLEIKTEKEIDKENTKNELYQRLVSVLSNSIDQDKLDQEKQEEVSRKRIERKLEKR